MKTKKKIKLLKVLSIVLVILLTITMFKLPSANALTNVTTGNHVIHNLDLPNKENYAEYSNDQVFKEPQVNIFEFNETIVNSDYYDFEFDVYCPSIDSHILEKMEDKYPTVKLNKNGVKKSVEKGKFIIITINSELNLTGGDPDELETADYYFVWADEIFEEIENNTGDIGFLTTLFQNTTEKQKILRLTNHEHPTCVNSEPNMNVEFLLYDFDGIFSYKLTHDNAPVFTGKDSFITNIDNPITENQIREQLSAVDEIDGSCEIKLIEDNYTVNNNKLGQHTIKYSATDKAGNTAFFIVNIFVKDITAPKLNLPDNTFNIDWNQEITEEQIKFEILNKIIDNVDAQGQLDFEVIYFDESFNSKSRAIGNYDMDIKVADLSGNIAHYSIIIKSNKTDDSPFFEIQQINTITSYKNKIDPTEIIKGKFIVKDNYKFAHVSNPYITTNEYEKNYNEPGTYKVGFKVKNGIDNESEEQFINIKVEDKIPPIFYASDAFIKVDTAISLNLADIIDLLIKTGQLPTNAAITNYSLVESESTYPPTNAEPGTHKVVLRNKIDPSIQKTVNIKTYKSNTTGESTETPEKPENNKTLATKAKDFMKKNWIWFAVGGASFIALIIVISIIKRKR